MNRALIALAITMLCFGAAIAQQPPGPAVIPMPAGYSKGIDALQEQRTKLDKDYEQVIPLYKDYVAKREAIQAQATLLITRAALAAHMSLEQLDNSDLVKNDKGVYEWRERPRPTAPASTPTTPPR